MARSRRTGSVWTGPGALSCWGTVTYYPGGSGPQRRREDRDGMFYRQESDQEGEGEWGGEDRGRGGFCLPSTLLLHSSGLVRQVLGYLVSRTLIVKSLIIPVRAAATKPRPPLPPLSFPPLPHLLRRHYCCFCCRCPSPLIASPRHASGTHLTSLPLPSLPLVSAIHFPPFLSSSLPLLPTLSWVL